MWYLTVLLASRSLHLMPFVILLRLKEVDVIQWLLEYTVWTTPDIIGRRELEEVYVADCPHSSALMHPNVQQGFET